jgi:hypothetical protein
MHYPARDLPPHDSSADSSCAGFFGVAAGAEEGGQEEAEDESMGYVVDLGDELDDTTSFPDLLFGQPRDESSLDDERLGDSALTELQGTQEMSGLRVCAERGTYQLVLAELTQVNDGDGTFRGINLGGIEGDELFRQVSRRPNLITLPDSPCRC